MTAPPHQITLSIGDSGPAIDDAIFNRLFRPFYTTKPDGLGMGLVISRSIVEAHGGCLSAERRATGGLVMHFTLPAVEDFNSQADSRDQTDPQGASTAGAR